MNYFQHITHAVHYSQEGRLSKWRKKIKNIILNEVRSDEKQSYKKRLWASFMRASTRAEIYAFWYS